MSESFFDFDIEVGSLAGNPVTKSGLYEVEIVTATTMGADSGKPRALFRCIVRGGEHSDQVGLSLDEGFNIPTSADDNVLVFWDKFMTSLGLAKPGKKVRPSPKLIKGRRGYLRFELAAPGAKYDKKTWITTNQYAAQMAALAATSEFAVAESEAPATSAEPVVTAPEAASDLAEFGIG